METLGFDSHLGGYVIPPPANMHVHFRFDQATMERVVPETANVYSYATAMPNFGKTNLIHRPDQALAYKKRVLAIAHQYNIHFDLNVPFYIEPHTSPRVVVDGFKQGAWIAGKLYPRSGTTQSDEGVDFRELGKLRELFAAMAEHGMKLLGHFENIFEASGEEIDPWFREQHSIAHVQKYILEPNPNIEVVWEHVTSLPVVDAIRAWRKSGYKISATVAPQYLVWYRKKLLEKGMNPAWYSIPVLKGKSDMHAVGEFILDGYGFAGDDSAPHPIASKARPCGCSGGVFTAPASFFVYFRFFKESGRKDWFEKFVNFVSIRGREFYGLPIPERRMVVIEEPWKMPMTFGNGIETFIPMLRDEMIPYRLVSIEEASERSHQAT